MLKEELINFLKKLENTPTSLSLIFKKLSLEVIQIPETKLGRAQVYHFIQTFFSNNPQTMTPVNKEYLEEFIKQTPLNLIPSHLSRHQKK